MKLVERSGDFHPLTDGDWKEEPFFRLLIEALQGASRGRRRAELRVLQNELLRRGWHP